MKVKAIHPDVVLVTIGLNDPLPTKGSYFTSDKTTETWVMTVLELNEFAKEYPSAKIQCEDEWIGHLA